MNPFNLFRPSPPEQKASRAYAAHVRNLPEAVWTPRNYRNFTKEGYKVNVVCYQAINRIADAIGSLTWTAFDSSGRQLEAHPYLDLINRPLRS